MLNYEHKKLIEAIAELDEMPMEPSLFDEWLGAVAHVDFLRKNADDNELVIHASGRHIFVHTVVVKNERLVPIDQSDLLQWSIDSYSSIATYVADGGFEDVWVERGLGGVGSKTLEGAVQLVFGRTFEGWEGPDRTYFELNQEYAHLADIHWRSEKRAYCRFDRLGDLQSIVAVTGRQHSPGGPVLVSFKWEPLEEYLAASGASLVRLFDFTLLRCSKFSGWPEGLEQVITESQDFFYQRKTVPGYADYTRGVQIIRLRDKPQRVFNRITANWFGTNERCHVEFLAHDWRNDRVTKISTDSSATTNYFEAKGNTLPFDLSPVFFRPEVLVKYKADRDKYTVSDRQITCRASWHLETFDVNEAGQIFTYICYLRRLPYEEQLYWLSYNEPPKAAISRRAILQDFVGEFLESEHALNQILDILRRWRGEGVAWWKLREEQLLTNVNVPLANSRDEWAEAFVVLHFIYLLLRPFRSDCLRSGGPLRGKLM